MIKYVFYDLDGTITDSEPLHAYSRKEVLKKLSIYSNELSMEAIGRSKIEYYRMIVKKFNFDMDPSELVKMEFDILLDYINKNPIPLEKNAKETVIKLKSLGIGVAIVSSSDKPYIIKALDNIGLTDYVDFIMSSNDVTNAKPDPEIYLKALKKTGLDEKDVIVVEDTDTGINAAYNADLKVIGFRNPEENNILPTYKNASMVIEDHLELLNIIKQ